MHVYSYVKAYSTNSLGIMVIQDYATHCYCVNGFEANSQKVVANRKP